MFVKHARSSGRKWEDDSFDVFSKDFAPWGGIAFARPLRARLVNGMKVKTLRFGKGFSVCGGNQHSQAATMVIAPGDCEGGPQNRHRGADQWLFVLSGRGLAILAGRARPIKAGSLVLIERGTTHEIRNTGRAPLKTLNIYVPPAYRSGGNELPRGRAD